MALDQENLRNEITCGGPQIWNLRPGFKFYQGALIAHRVGSALIEIPKASARRTDLVFVGYYDGYTIDATSADGDADGAALMSDGVTLYSIEHRSGIIGPLNTGSGVNEILVIGGTCYAYDDDTAYATDDNGTLSFLGLVHYVDPESGLVWVNIDSASQAWGNVASALAENDPGPRPFFARAVVTSLAACAAADGILTASANGALGTQDGITDLAVGDVVFIYEGTTNLPSADDAGPYKIDILGAGGAKFILSRPAWYAHGNTIPQSVTIDIGGEGTKWAGNAWRSFADVNQEIGDDAPLFWPRTDATDLVSGTGSTTMWIRDVHRVSAMNVTGNHSFYASTLTAGAGSGAVTITGTASEHYSVLAVNF